MEQTDAARLFIGLPLDESARAALTAVRESLRSRIAGRFSEPDQYHITLCFLGSTPRAAIPRLSALLDALPKRSFSLRLGALGSFKGGSILYAGLDHPVPALFALQCALSDALYRSGFPVEPGEYRPHITLARQTRTLDTLPRPEPVAFPVRRMILYESTRLDGRLQYIPLYSAPLDAPRAK